MSIERYTVEFSGSDFTRLFGDGLTSYEEIAALAEVDAGGTYFYGGIQDGSSGTSVYFGQGPGHDIFRQMVAGENGDDGDICTCQIGVNKRRNKIESIMFHEDPGNCTEIPIEEDEAAAHIARRENRIHALADSLPANLCEKRIPITWFYGSAFPKTEYLYFPYSGELETY
jgi:hypothetical protein